MRNIDIMLAVKAEEIMNDYGKLSKDINKPVLITPSILNKNYLRLLPEDDSVVCVDEELTLSIKANIGDMIRLNVRSLNIETTYSAALVKIEPMNVMRDGVVSMVSLPVVESVVRSVATVDMKNTVDVDINTMKDYHWMIKVNDLPSVDRISTMYYLSTIAIYRDKMLMGYIALESGLILDHTVMM
ncbi:inclusion body family protein [Xenorhabdus nematophila]|uniref:Methionine-rich PixA inclusion body protein n=2 Tax=Xenorhabdus nematophila TaxID=628 RepID=D3V9K3_XENNA|nr:inclusion body family protein [Xenorhabdus nematophila]CEE94004.1 Methionine-rich PixA inclusion body protein [Xenorhabdus nematophila str. Anatoliense]CEF30747.1 Methionine-rich PixA inclusion body protein [Xenorhabdus nematophila str. Websteri]AAT12276.1 PixA [Xenorhabdus nematophila]AYA40804.1 inclusion body protein [Xenorhabdus nematophila]KHD28637.1 inclusion body protein [Xenorhabdus nematophila]